MVRHNDSRIQQVFPAIGSKTRLQSQVHRTSRQPPTMPGTVGNKKDSVVLLVVRQIPPVLILPKHWTSLARTSVHAAASDSPEHFPFSKPGNSTLGRDSPCGGDSPCGSGRLARLPLERCHLRGRVARAHMVLAVSTEYISTNPDPSQCPSTSSAHNPRRSLRAPLFSREHQSSTHPAPAP